MELKLAILLLESLHRNGTAPPSLIKQVVSLERPKEFWTSSGCSKQVLLWGIDGWLQVAALSGVLETILLLTQGFTVHNTMSLFLCRAIIASGTNAGRLTRLDADGNSTDISLFKESCCATSLCARYTDKRPISQIALDTTLFGK